MLYGTMVQPISAFKIHCGDRGFTLLELLVARVIIGLLAAHVAARYFCQLGKSELRSTQAQIAALLWR